MESPARGKGPTAERVAANVRAVRKDRGLDLAGLAERMAELGQPIGVTGLSKLENGDRRVHVDDLMALAVALDVSPNRLLLPAGAGDESFALVPNASASSLIAWRWATGEHPLADPWSRHPEMIDLGRTTRFAVENRPHNLPDDTPVSELGKHREALAAVEHAVTAAWEDGLSMKTVAEYVSLLGAVEPLRRELKRRKNASKEHD